MTNSLKATTLAKLLAFTLLVPIYSHAETSSEAMRSVNHVNWYPQVQMDAPSMMAQPIPDDVVRLYFIRQADEDNVATSANLSINGEYQTSLQPGGVTQVYSCAGANNISVVTTSQKTNNLAKNAIELNLPANESYFFYIEVDDQGRIKLTQEDAEVATNLMTDMRYQQHHISRVTPYNCPEVAAPAPDIEPPPQVPVEYPVLEEEVSIELRILFDFDKSIIKPQYFTEVEDVAVFMKQYGDTNAVIEGHTDSIGTKAYNQKLSERRVKAVQDLLIQKYGIDPSRLSIKGYGESKPVATNSTSEGRRQNRRVIAVIDQE